MLKVGLLSDTHGFLDDRIEKHFAQVDEIWHAGDIGENGVLEKLQSLKPIRAVYGNIETPSLQRELPEIVSSSVEGLKFLMIHIAGRPGRYAKGITKLLAAEQPKLLICGHSHIARVEKDKKYNMIFMNPGAAGHQGFHKKRTIMRFSIDAGQLKNLEMIELGFRGRT